MLTRLGKRQRDQREEDRISLQLAKKRRTVSCSRLGQQFLIFFAADLIKIIVDYMATISFFPYYQFGSRGHDDGQWTHANSFCLYDDEIFVVDASNYRIQVFHQLDGRYLRQWELMQDQWQWEPITGLSSPYSVAVNNEYALVSLPQKPAVMMYDVKTGRCLRCFHNSTSYRPLHVRICGDEVFVTDLREIFIYLLNSPMNVKSVSKTPFTEPRKIILDNDDMFVLKTSRLSRKEWIEVYDQKSFIGRKQVVYQEDEGMKRKLRSFTVHGSEIIVCLHQSIIVFDRSSAKIIREFGRLGGTVDADRFTALRDVEINNKAELFVLDDTRVRVYQ